MSQPKLRRLPESDLARIAPMPSLQMRRALESMKLSIPPHSYRPFRQNILDILNVQAGELVELPRTPWETVKRSVERLCKRSESEEKANLAVAEGLYNYASTKELVGRRQEFLPLALGMSAKVTYWSQLVLSIDNGPVVAFFDPRRTKKLTEVGRRFAFSVMHERIRAADPDYADVRFLIVQFENSKEGSRDPILHFDDDVELFSFAELDAMVRSAYSTWQDVLSEREQEERRTGSDGPLFGS